MRYRILVVGDSSVTEAAFPSSDPEFAAEVVEWRDFAPATVSERADLVVLVADSDADAALAESLAVPVLAILSDFPAPLLERVDDFVASGCTAEELRARARRLLHASGSDVAAVSDRLADALALQQLVGSDPAFLSVVRQIPLYARADAPVLIAGETGTGKELCARALHFLSARQHQPFIAVECGSVPDHLFENELFGHARGAYTDAGADQKGLIALSDRGTLFLDEIDSLSAAAQGKLLRFLQEKTYRPLGGEKFLRADVRVIAATNHDLEAAVKEKRFRADLFYRLNVLQIRMPALRERRSDIPELARHFLHMAAERIGARRRFAPATLRKLSAYDWPGNVRELSNLIQRAALLAEGESILPCQIALPAMAEPLDPQTFRGARRQMLEVFERTYVKTLLDKHAGNISGAAREAQYERRAFGRLAKKYRLTR